MQHQIRPARDGALEERDVDVDAPINASGHVQELDRNFSLLSITAVGIVTGNTWAALGGSIVSSAGFPSRPRSDDQTRLSRFTMEAPRESSMSCENNASKHPKLLLMDQALICMAIALRSRYSIGSSRRVLLSLLPLSRQTAVSITGPRSRPVDMGAPAAFSLAGGTFSHGSWAELQSQPSLAT